MLIEPGLGSWSLETQGEACRAKEGLLCGTGPEPRPKSAPGQEAELCGREMLERRGGLEGAGGGWEGPPGWRRVGWRWLCANVRPKARVWRGRGLTQTKRLPKEARGVAARWNVAEGLQALRPSVDGRRRQAAGVTVGGRFEP